MKNDYTKIHPQLQEVARKSPRISFGKKTLWLVNLMVSLMPAPRLAPDVLVENVFIRGQKDQRKIRLRIYKPASATGPTPALLWLHGGGYLIGKPEMNDRGCAEYVRELGLVVVSVAYRRAPRHPFPAALDDSYAALTWLAAHAGQLGIDTARIALGGESAGGGLAAALAQLAHDRQEVKPAFQLLVYPMLDDRTVVRADADDSNNVMWTQKSNRLGWESYLGQACGADDAPAYAVPARRADLSGLPPAWIGVGALDLFHDEDVAYAQRLTASGVACELVVVPGAFHGFDQFDPELPIVQAFRQSKLAALRRGLFPAAAHADAAL